MIFTHSRARAESHEPKCCWFLMEERLIEWMNEWMNEWKPCINNAMSKSQRRLERRLAEHFTHFYGSTHYRSSQHTSLHCSMQWLLLSHDWLVFHLVDIYVTTCAYNVMASCCCAKYGCQVRFRPDNRILHSNSLRKSYWPRLFCAVKFGLRWQVHTYHSVARKLIIQIKLVRKHFTGCCRLLPPHGCLVSTGAYVVVIWSC